MSGSNVDHDRPPAVETVITSTFNDEKKKKQMANILEKEMELKEVPVILTMEDNKDELLDDTLNKLHNNIKHPKSGDDDEINEVTANLEKLGVCENAISDKKLPVPVERGPPGRPTHYVDEYGNGSNYLNNKETDPMGQSSFVPTAGPAPVVGIRKRYLDEESSHVNVKGFKPLGNHQSLRPNDVVQQNYNNAIGYNVPVSNNVFDHSNLAQVNNHNINYIQNPQDNFQSMGMFNNHNLVHFPHAVDVPISLTSDQYRDVPLPVSSIAETITPSNSDSISGTGDLSLSELLDTASCNVNELPPSPPYDGSQVIYEPPVCHDMSSYNKESPMMGNIAYTNSPPFAAMESPQCLSPASTIPPSPLSISSPGSTDTEYEIEIFKDVQKQFPVLQPITEYNLNEQLEDAAYVVNEMDKNPPTTCTEFILPPTAGNPLVSNHQPQTISGSHPFSNAPFVQSTVPNTVQIIIISTTQNSISSPPIQKTQKRQPHILPKPSHNQQNTDVQQISPHCGANAIRNQGLQQTDLMPPSFEKANEENIQAKRSVAALSRERLTFQDEDRDTILHLAVVKKDFYIATEYVLRCKREKLLSNVINLTNKSEQTPIFLATATNQPSMIQLLLRCGADPNKEAVSTGSSGKEYQHRGPLHYAAQRGKKWIESVRMLLKSSVDVNKTDSEGQTPLHCAVLAHGLSKEDDVIDSKDIITELKRHNAQLGAKELKAGKTALHMAVEKMSLDLLKHLCSDVPPSELPSLLNRPTYDGLTTLHLAAGLRMQDKSEHISLVRYLINNGADTTLKNQAKHTPKKAISSDFPELFNILNVKKS